jgi:outer membrane protein assembly factor BamB
VEAWRVKLMSEMDKVSGETGRNRRVRWWIPIVVVVLAGANIARVRASGNLEGNFKTLWTVVSVMLGFLCLLVWLMFLSGMRWRTRFAVLGVVVAAAIGFGLVARIDGTASGNAVFRVVWRWTPPRDGLVGDLRPAGEAASRFEATTDYPGFLGADRRGVVEGVALERDWDGHTPKLLWRHPVGLGWSAFAVAGPRAITQEQRGDSEITVCYDLASGRPLWSRENHVRFHEGMGGDGPRATPTMADGRVYAMGATGILDCLDAATGKLVWSRDVLKENGLPNLEWAKSCSPLVYDDVVVVTGGMTNGPTLIAYKRRDGAPAWQAGKDKASYSSPTLATLAGQRQIVSINAASVTGHDPADGRELWNYGWATDKWPKSAQPVIIDGDRIFVSAGYGAGCVMLKATCGPDRKWGVAELWKNRAIKSNFSEMVARGGMIYGLDDGILVCVDAATGERKWKEGRYGYGQVLLAGETLVVQTEPGPVVLVEASPQSGGKELARLPALSSKTWNTPSLAGDLLLVRNDQEAVCYQLPLLGEKPSSAGGPAGK